MTQVHDIRKEYFEKGKSISQIARELGYDRKTIRAQAGHGDCRRDTGTGSLSHSNLTAKSWMVIEVTAWLFFGQC